MTRQEFLNAPRMNLALTVFVLAVLLTGWALEQALHPPALAAAASRNQTPAALTLPPQPLPVDVDLVAATDIYSLDRKPPRNRYRIPGEKGATDAVAPTAASKPVVLGTAIYPDSTKTFAMISLSGRQERGYHVGESVGPYTLVAIKRQSVIFAGPGGLLIEINRSR